MFFFILLTIVKLFAKHTEANFEVMQTFSEKTNVKTFVIFYCENLIFEDFKHFTQLSMQFNGRTMVFNLNEIKEIETFMEFKPYFMNIWLDSNCSNSKYFLDELSERNYLNFSRRLFISGELNQSISLLHTQNINLDSVVFVVDKNEIYQVKSVELRQNTAIQVQRIQNKNEISRSYDLRGHTIPVVFNIPTIPSGEIVMKYMTGQGGEHKDNINRFGNQYAVFLSELLNFKMHWIRTNSWGYLLKDNKSFSGAVGFIQRKEAVFSTSAVYYTLARHPHIDVAYSNIPLRMAFLFRHPKSGRGVHGLQSPFLRPLSNATWMLIAFLTILIVLSLIVTQRKISLSSTSATILAVIGVLSQQGMSENLQRSKVIVLSTLTMSFLLFQFYSASIVGSLLTPIPKTINNLKRLQESDLVISMEDFLLPIFTYNPWAAEFYKKKVQGQERFITSNDAPEVIRKGIVYFGYLDSTYDGIKRTFSAAEIDELQEVQFFRTHNDMLLNFPIAKYSPFKESIRVGSLRIAESGVAEYWKKRWIVDKLKGNLVQFRVVEVDFARVKGVFYLMVFGITISLVIFLVEVILAVLKNINKSKAHRQ